MQKQFFAVFSWSRKRTYDLLSREDRCISQIRNPEQQLFSEGISILRDKWSSSGSRHASDSFLRTQFDVTMLSGRCHVVSCSDSALTKLSPVFRLQSPYVLRTSSVEAMLNFSGARQLNWRFFSFSLVTSRAFCFPFYCIDAWNSSSNDIVYSYMRRVCFYKQTYTAVPQTAICSRF